MLQIVLRTLFKVALVTGRAVAWPDIPCARGVEGSVEWPIMEGEIRRPNCGLKYR